MWRRLENGDKMAILFQKNPEIASVSHLKSLSKLVSLGFHWVLLRAFKKIWIRLHQKHGFLAAFTGYKGHQTKSILMRFFSGENEKDIICYLPARKSIREKQCSLYDKHNLAKRLTVNVLDKRPWENQDVSRYEETWIDLNNTCIYLCRISTKTNRNFISLSYKSCQKFWKVLTDRHQVKLSPHFCIKC